MQIERIEPRGFNAFLGQQRWDLKEITVPGVAAQVVLRLHLAGGAVRDVVVHVPPIDVQELVRARQIDSNTAAMALGLAQLDTTTEAARGIEDLPSVMLVQPKARGGPADISPETIDRAKQLLAWISVPPRVRMPASADDLTIAVTDGDVYWHIASLRVDGPPASPERATVFVNREPLVEDHWTYHQSGEIHHKRSGVADATREDQPLPLHSLGEEDSAE